MSSLKLLTVTILALVFQTELLAQSQTPVSDSIDSNFEELIHGANNYKSYKVVKKAELQDTRREIRNQVSKVEKKISGFEEKIDDQQKKLDEAQEKRKSSEAHLKSAIDDKDKISVLGIATQKSTYNTVVSIIILGLLSAFIFIFLRFKTSYQTIRHLRESLDDNEKEFEDYRKKALSTQQKLGRQLVDERKKADKAMMEK